MQLRILGQASAGDIARATGRSAESIYYHLNALVAVRLAKQASRRPGVKKPELVYEAVGKDLRLPTGRRAQEVGELVRKSVAAGFRQTVRGYLEAAKRAETDSATSKMMHVIRMNARLRPEDAKELLRRIEKLVQFADSRRDEDGVKLVWSSVVYPARTET